MLALIALLTTGALTPPSDGESKKVYAAIWSDLQLNGMIGNGNWLASLWSNAGDIGHIRDLVCTRTVTTYGCTFSLKRDGGAVKVFNEDAPQTLLCEANFIDNGEQGLAVEHLPPLPTGGHSRTTMKCKRP